MYFRSRFWAVILERALLVAAQLAIICMIALSSVLTGCTKQNLGSFLHNAGGVAGLTQAPVRMQAGAVPTGRVIDIRDFGARCDGSDDAGAIQSAINSLQNGDTLVFSCQAGVGQSGLIVQGKSNITITGNGGNTGIRLVATPSAPVLWFPRNGTLALLNGSSVTVKNMMIDLNGFIASGISVDHVSNSLIDGNNIFGTPWVDNTDPNVIPHACIAAWGNSGNIYSNNRIRNCYWGLYLGNGGNPGPVEWYENYFQVLNNDIADNTWDGIAHHGIGGTFIGNKINNVVGSGIKFCPAGSDRLLFQGNTITNVKASQGVQVCPTNRGTGPVDILDNYIDTTSDGGVTLDNGQPHLGKVTIAGNTIRNSIGSGNIYILSSADTEIHNNDLQDTGPGQVGIKIRTDYGGLVQNVNIYNNNIRDNSDFGVWLFSAPGGNTMSNVNIHDNSVHNNRVGVYVESQGSGAVSSVYLNNNCFANNSTSLYDDRGQLSAVGQSGGCSDYNVSSGAPTPTPVSTSTPTPASTPISGNQFRINLAGSGYTDSSGNTWSADPGLPGQNYSVPDSISNTNDGALYQSQKWDSAPLNFAFSVPNGSYQVTLKFAEIYWDSAGQRVFDASINGQKVLSNFDIFTQAGGKFKAVDRVFTLNVTNGQLAFNFTASVDCPGVNAIVVTPLATSTPTPTPATTATPVPASTPVASNTMRINVSGPAYTDTNGVYWSADYGLPGNPDSTSNAISGTTNAALYQTQKWSSGPMDYQFSLPNGAYNITLKFAEIYWDSSGQRIFDVDANGQRVISNFDIFAQAGGKFKAVDRSFNVSVTGGQLIIHMAASADCPAINGIEIVPASATQIRINMGGSSYTDGSGSVWSADPGLAGRSYSVTNTISGTTNQSLYQTQKWEVSSLDHNFSVPNGSYKITLKFAELFWDSSGQRVFDVYINGIRVLSKFDILRQAGGKFKPVDRTFTVNVTDNQITIHMQGRVDNPAINALEILPN